MTMAKKQKVDKYEGLREFIQQEMGYARDQADELSVGRVDASEYYKGNLPKPDKEDQSRYTSTDVHDVVMLIVPQLVEMFCGTEYPVEFCPTGEEDVEQARQRTAYVDYIVKSDNDWMRCVSSVLKDGLVKKVGYLKCYYDKSEKAEIVEYAGLNEEEYMAIISDESAEIIKESVEMQSVQHPDPYSGAMMSVDVPASYDVTVRRVTTRDRFAIEPIPPEEVWFEKGVRALDDRCAYIAHSSFKTKSELLAMGYTEKEIEDSGGETGFDTLVEQTSREATDTSRDVNGYRYTEHYVLFDQDGDDVAERLKVCTIGDTCNILHVEGCGLIPIVEFTPDPEPHTVIGHCPTDYVIPVQKANTQMTRDILDSLGFAVYQRPIVLDGEANMNDILNTDIGHPIREYTQGAVRYESPAFVGREALTMIDHMMQERESKTGVSKPSAALDPKALQSSTQTGVQAAITASQGQVKYIARVFAETTLKKLFRVLNELVLRYQSQERIVRLTGKFVAVDPRVWNADMDVEVNIGAISHTREEKVQMMAMVVAKQESILQTMGISNPLITLPQYMKGLKSLLTLSGVKDAANYFNVNIDEQQLQQYMDAKKPQPTPEQQMVMIEQQKNMERNKIDLMKTVMTDDLERDKLNADMLLKAKEIELKYKEKVDTALISSVLERDREHIRQSYKTQMMSNGNQQTQGNQ